MTDKIDDGGPAFPLIVPPHFQYAQEGVTMRQWYAGQALAGILAHPDTNSSYEEDALVAFEIADAMIAHEKKERSDGSD